MNRIRLTLMTACALGTALGTMAVPPAPPAPVRPPRSTTVPEPRPDLTWYQEQHETRLKEAAKGGWEIVLLGDSLVVNWSPKRHAAWAPYKVLNLGCAGDRTENLLWRLAHGEVDGLTPKLVILLIGSNNTGHRRDPPERIAAGIRAVLDDLQRRMPEVRIVLLGLVPRGLTPDDFTRVNNRQTNALIKDFADNQKVFFADASEGFVRPDGSLADCFGKDKVHLNDAGYVLLMDAAGPLVTRLMGEAAPDTP